MAKTDRMYFHSQKSGGRLLNACDGEEQRVIDGRNYSKTSMQTDTDLSE